MRARRPDDSHRGGVYNNTYLVGGVIGCTNGCGCSEHHLTAQTHRPVGHWSNAEPIVVANSLARLPTRWHLLVKQGLRLAHGG